ncbi:helix-turn-helix transcriptional regulator [bacterium]|nr:helix-turn-helix transcriptional regulator [bacterium]
MEYKRGAELRAEFKQLKDKFINDLSEFEREIIQSHESAPKDDEFNMNQLYFAIREVSALKQTICNFNDEIQKKFVADTIISSIFTKTECKIFKLIIKEYTTREIANEMNISYKTVETHLRNMLKKICDDSMFSAVIKNSERYQEFKNKKYDIYQGNEPLKNPIKLLRFLYAIVSSN